MNFFFGIAGKFNAYVPSGSMENTLETGDRIMGLRLVQTYNRGDVAIFKYDGKNYYVKRIIGIEGDVISAFGKSLYFIAGFPRRLMR